MFDGAIPDHPNAALALRLPADAYYHLIRTLRLTLPPPLSDGPEDLARRDHAAIARVAALVPANAAEADLAAMFVAASEQWKDCLRLAQLPETTLEWAAKCRAQAIGMMRQANGALRLLLRLQEARGKREANPAACNSAAWTEHCAIALMAEALAPAMQPAPAQPAKPAASRSGAECDREPSAPCRGPALPTQSSLPATGGRGEKPCAENERTASRPPEGEGARPGAGESGLAEAEHYAVLYPERAALIRRMGRLPHDLAFGPPDADVVRALVTAHTPALAALDREYAAARAA